MCTIKSLNENTEDVLLNSYMLSYERTWFVISLKKSRITMMENKNDSMQLGVFSQIIQMKKISSLLWFYRCMAKKGNLKTVCNMMAGGSMGGLRMVCASPVTFLPASQAEQLSVPNGASRCCKTPLDLLIPSGVVALLPL